MPGHVRFLRNMLAGVGGVDACLFVVAATEGWKPQSEEHLRILELVGVRHGVVALTKVDVLDDPELVELAALEVAERTAGTFLAGAPIVPVAAPLGHGLRRADGRARRARPHRRRRRRDRGRARLWIDRVFAAKGSGTVVTGTLTDGAIADRRPPRASSRTASRCAVRAIQTLGRSVDAIGPGNRVALNLVGVDHDELRRGDAVVAPRPLAHDSAMVDASLHVLAALDHEVSRRGAHLAYIGSGEHAVRVRVLGPDAIRPGGRRPRAAAPRHRPAAPARRPLRAARVGSRRDRRRRRGARRGAGAPGVEGPARPDASSASSPSGAGSTPPSSSG